jgi:hypothetical protein
MNILESIQELLDSGFSKSDIEHLSGVTKNSLASVLSGKRGLSKKNEIRLKRFLESDIPDPLTFKKGNIVLHKKSIVKEDLITKEADSLSYKKEQLQKIIKSPATKGYFHGIELPEFNPEVGIEGISDPRLPY